MWLLPFSESGEEMGTISFPYPQSYVDFAVDITPDPEKYTPFLYRELRIAVSVTGDGMFKQGLSSASVAQFILTRETNACFNSSDFIHWIFEIDNHISRFRLFGELRSAEYIYLAPKSLTPPLKQA